MADTQNNQRYKNEYIPAGRGFDTSGATICAIKVPIAQIERALANPEKYVSTWVNNDGIEVKQLSLLIGRSSFPGAPYFASFAPNQVRGEVPDNALDEDQDPENN